MQRGRGRARRRLRGGAPAGGRPGLRRPGGAAGRERGQRRRRPVRRGTTRRAGGRGDGGAAHPERAHRGGWRRCAGAGGRVAEPGSAGELIARADLVVDGIVGIGGKGGLREEAVPLADAAARSRAAVVAVDLPSGVDADTGQVRGAAVRADLTVTFGAHKAGLLVDPAREYAGSVRLVDIGLPLPAEAAELEALQHADVARLLPAPGAESDKYRRGVVGIAAGVGPLSGRGRARRRRGAAGRCRGGAVRRSGRGTGDRPLPGDARVRPGAEAGGAGAGVGRGTGRR